MPTFELAATNAVAVEGDDLVITLVRQGSNLSAKGVTVHVASPGGYVDRGEHTVSFAEGDAGVITGGTCGDGNAAEAGCSATLRLPLLTKTGEGDMVTVRIVENPGSYRVGARNVTTPVTLTDALPTFQVTGPASISEGDTHITVKLHRVGSAAAGSTTVKLDVEDPGERLVAGERGERDVSFTTGQTARRWTCGWNSTRPRSAGPASR